MRKSVVTTVAAALAAATLGPAFARASCVPTTPAEHRARAQVIFDGVALEGPTPTGTQRFRVVRYLKGRGATVVRVETGTIRRADGSGTLTSVSVVALRGERWRIFARATSGSVLRTSLCDGSHTR
jgi:hypothetical protein